MTALAGSVAQAAAEAVPADGVFGIAWLLVALPMVGAAVLLLVGRRGGRWGHWRGVAAPGSSVLVALVLWIAMLGQPAGEHGDPEHESDQDRRAGCGDAEPVAPAVTAPSDQQQHRGPDQRQRDEQPGESEDAVGGDGLGRRLRDGSGKCSHHPLLSS